jgi:glycosyltransferase involved in cell wall biosynthesis
MAVRGGAEKLTLALLEHFPGNDFATGYVNRTAFVGPINPSGRVIELGVAQRGRLATALSAFSRFRNLRTVLNGYDWVLFSGIYAPIAAVRRAGLRNVLYCHAIPRFCFDLREYYRRQLPAAAVPLFWVFVAMMKRRYRRSLSCMDEVVANSENVRQSLYEHFRCSAVVVNPPVATTAFRYIADGSEYLSLGRLEPLKRVDVVIRAFLRMPQRRLIVASGGSELPRLQSLAAGAPNIRFTGWLSEEELQVLVGRVRAAIYVPVNEDFGMAPVEAMAAGKPVIGVQEGGLLETIQHGRTGVLIDGRLTPASICEAVDYLERLGPITMRADCERRAAAFSENRFIERMRKVLDPQG